MTKGVAVPRHFLRRSGETGGGATPLLEEVWRNWMKTVSAATARLPSLPNLPQEVAWPHTPARGVLKVTSVKDGSPADLAGLVCGNIIVAVNGTSCQHMRLMELNQRLCDSAGQKLTLTVDRQGKQIEVALAVPDAPSRHGNR